MKNDTQHLEFLISQYVDGTLDAASKKSLEQRMVVDPDSRAAYQEQREVQDVLDDWGNRLPWINWEKFDAELTHRLEKETVGGQRITFWRSWGKAMAVAASLLVAVGVGYVWRGISASVNDTNSAAAQVAKASAPSQSVTVEENAALSQGMHGSLRRVEFPEFPKSTETAGNVQFSVPPDVAATESLKQAVEMSLPKVANANSVVQTQPNAVTAEAPEKPRREVPPDHFP